ncbi:polysaccharide biosynthesis tyrosine autokinase [Vibrio sp. ABG19]|uniref:GumC family protein n=1 Tax=Vibrio sp. ABG19 TaxID=2817385 RepID=UPI00249E5451|nr:polysaccharide biosynthesis tyrosine autokinase [Vibrio sp. ABG19]WGY46808.1 polysaccharide biosynthesis tyrosine autokinase [Vibrio sp. ABG19]
MSINHFPKFDSDSPWSKENEVSLRDYFGVIQRVWWKILILVGVVTLSVALIVSLMPAVYKATATIIFESQTTTILPVDDVYLMNNKNSEEYYKTQYEILKSRPIAERVILSLDLVDKLANRDKSVWLEKLHLQSALDYLSAGWHRLIAALGGATSETDQPINPMNLAVDSYLEKLEIVPVVSTQLVKIRFSASNPELAATIANAHANLYLESNLEAKLLLTKSAENWMAGRLSALKKSLADSEQNLQAYRESEMLIDADGIQHLPALKLDELTMKLINAQQALASIKNTYSQVENWGQNSAARVTAIPAVADVLADPLVQQLKNQLGAAKQKVNELAVRYRPRHPVMVAAQQNLRTIEANLLGQISSVIEGIKKQYEVARANEASIQASIEATKNRYHELGKKASVLDALKQEVDANRNLYMLFATRVKQVTEMSGGQVVNARVIAPAIIPYVPFKPQKALMIGLAFATSLFTGVFLAFVRDAMSNRLTNAVDVECKLGYPLLGVVPMVKNPHHEPRPKLISQRNGDLRERRFLEAIHSLRAGIFLKGKLNKTVMVTSSLSHEGKSNLAINMAKVCGLFERVVLIECDLCRPVMAQELDIDPLKPGLVELVQGTNSIEECLTTHQSYQVITAGQSVNDSKSIIGSPRFDQLLASLATQFDRIILDCPPVLIVSDPEIISTYTDMIIYVVRSDSTPINQVKSGIEKLERVKEQPINIVINGLDVPFASKDRDFRDYYDNSFRL